MDDVVTFKPGNLFEVEVIDLLGPVEPKVHPRFERPLQCNVRDARLLNETPWVRSLGKLTPELTTEGWRFPVLTEQPLKPRGLDLQSADQLAETNASLEEIPEKLRQTRVRPPSDTVVF